MFNDIFESLSHLPPTAAVRETLAEFNTLLDYRNSRLSRELGNLESALPDSLSDYYRQINMRAN